MRVLLAACVLFLASCQQPTPGPITPTPPDSNGSKMYYLFTTYNAPGGGLEIFSSQGSAVRKIGGAYGISDWQASTKRFLYSTFYNNTLVSNLDNTYNGTAPWGAAGASVYSPSWTEYTVPGPTWIESHIGNSLSLFVMTGSDTLSHLLSPPYSTTGAPYGGAGLAPVYFLDDNRIIVMAPLAYGKNKMSFYVVDISTSKWKLLGEGDQNVGVLATLSPDRQIFGWLDSAGGNYFMHDFLTALTTKMILPSSLYVSTNMPCTWSPDSRHFWLAGNFICDATAGKSVHVPLNSTNVYYGAMQFHYLTGPTSTDWSPDGKQIVFGYSDGGVNGIAIANVDGSNCTKLTFAGDNNPMWTPDGKNIIFTSNKTGSSLQYIMNPDGSNIRPSFTAPYWINGFSPLY